MPQESATLDRHGAQLIIVGPRRYEAFLLGIRGYYMQNETSVQLQYKFNLLSHAEIVNSVMRRL
jgi:hypothetical protein